MISANKGFKISYRHRPKMNISFEMTGRYDDAFIMRTRCKLLTKCSKQSPQCEGACTVRAKNDVIMSPVSCVKEGVTSMSAVWRVF